MDASPCIVTLNWVLRTILLILQCIIICCLPIVVLFTYKYKDIKVRFLATESLYRKIKADENEDEKRFITKGIKMGEQHSTEAAFSLLTQPSRVQFLCQLVK